MKMIKAVVLSVVLLSGAVMVYAWTTDCENTAGVYVSCGQQ